jgi:hypothetical protein
MLVDIDAHPSHKPSKKKVPDRSFLRLAHQSGEPDDDLTRSVLTVVNMVGNIFETLFTNWPNIRQIYDCLPDLGKAC